MNNEVLTKKAKDIREDILKMLHESKSGHTGGSLSAVEILLTLYYNVANVDPENPDMEDRDRIVMSKGHACPVLYAVLADKGYFPKDELWTLRKLHSNLQGHPDMKKTKGVDVNTGSLGHGVSIAMGMAMAAKYKKADYKVYVLMGDGESQEGITWEAAESASHYKLDNYTVILDHNGLQIDGTNDEVMSIGDIIKKYEAFGFECYKVDGHSFDALKEAFDAPFNGKPKFICCETSKGKGVSFMEDKPEWHGKAPNKEQLDAALKELNSNKSKESKGPSQQENSKSVNDKKKNKKNKHGKEENKNSESDLKSDLKEAEASANEKQSVESNNVEGSDNA